MMNRSLNVGEILKIQEILTGSSIPSDIQDALDKYKHTTQRGDVIGFSDLNIIHVLRAYLKEKRNV
jgi:hypothetical protein